MYKGGPIYSESSLIDHSMTVGFDVLTQYTTLPISLSDKLLGFEAWAKMATDSEAVQI